MGSSNAVRMEDVLDRHFSIRNARSCVTVEWIPRPPTNRTESEMCSGAEATRRRSRRRSWSGHVRIGDESFLNAAHSASICLRGSHRVPGWSQYRLNSRHLVGIVRPSKPWVVRSSRTGRADFIEVCDRALGVSSRLVTNRAAEGSLAGTYATHAHSPLLFRGLEKRGMARESCGCMPRSPSRC
jgi:hypothetical protein